MVYRELARLRRQVTFHFLSELLLNRSRFLECAAESNNRPLLPITCGDLGLTPKEVETKLQDSFQLAQAWGCVMLLDEADIFLAQRTVTDTQRNALVSGQCHVQVQCV